MVHEKITPSIELGSPDLSIISLITELIIIDIDSVMIITEINYSNNFLCTVIF